MDKRLSEISDMCDEQRISKIDFSSLQEFLTRKIKIVTIAIFGIFQSSKYPNNFVCNVVFLSEVLTTLYHERGKGLYFSTSVKKQWLVYLRFIFDKSNLHLGFFTGNY